MVVKSFCLFLGMGSMVVGPMMHADSTTALFASAIGDAMGAPIERLNLAGKNFRSTYPNGIRFVSDLQKTDWREINGKNVIPYTDDTAMALDTLRSLLYSINQNESRDDAIKRIAENYVNSMHDPLGWASPFRLPGTATLKNVHLIEKNIKNDSDTFVWYNPLTWFNTTWWQVGGTNDGGCGSVMRAYPFGLVFMHEPQKAAMWAAEHSKITHGAPIAVAACAAMATGVAYALQGKTPAVVVQKMADAASSYDLKTAEMIKEACALAADSNISATEVFKKWPGWAAHDAIAATVYVFMKHYDSVQHALYLGANMAGDSDSIASMAGALVGARSGIDTLPSDWLQNIEGREAMEHYAQKVAHLLTKRDA